jgi:uncharacterized protein YndB with AHSA1/START domain
MRLKDRPTVEVEVLVEAPPEKVWALVTDLGLMAEWSPEYQGGEWLDGATGPVRGARFLGRNKREKMEWQVPSTVTEADAPRVFAWAVGDPSNPGASWRFELLPEGAGTRVRQHCEIGPGPSGLTSAIERMPDREERIIENRQNEHRRNMTATLEGLKKAAES